MHRIAVTAIVMIISIVALPMVAGCNNPSTPPEASQSERPSSTPSEQQPMMARPMPAPPSETPITYPETGEGLWTIAEGESPVMGTRGTLLSFHVAVERDIQGLSHENFAITAAQTLGDPRGWTATQQWRFQRVGPSKKPHFTIYLATPATRDKLCQDGYDRYTSCRMGDKIVINIARWTKGVPHYNAPIETYRQYVLNHEVGHRLGKGHELCPGPGKPAPVMQQQSLGFHGCVAHSWPTVNGSIYTGPIGEYNDPIPQP